MKFGTNVLCDHLIILRYGGIFKVTLIQNGGQFSKWLNVITMKEYKSRAFYTNTVKFSICVLCVPLVIFTCKIIISFKAPYKKWRSIFKMADGNYRK